MKSNLYLGFVCHIFIVSKTFASNCCNGNTVDNIISMNRTLLLYNVSEKFVQEQCNELRYNGYHQNENYSSLIFGIPAFNESSRTVTIQPNMTSVDKNRTQVGPNDFIVAGHYKDIVAFLKCFENETITGFSLNRNGSWEEQRGSIKIQLQNIGFDSLEQKNFSSLFDVLFKFTVERILKYLEPIDVIRGYDAPLLGGIGAVKNLQRMTSTIKTIKQWLPGNKKVMEKIIKLYAKKESIKEKINDLIMFLDVEEARLNGMWLECERVQKDEKMLLIVTMYAKQSNDASCMYDLGKASTTIKDVGDIFRRLSL